MGNVMQQVEEFAGRHRVRGVWLKVLFVLACLVVFATVYALILPAITMEDGSYCGMEEHTHDQSCYSSTEPALTCTNETLGVHQHTDACYDGAGNLTCGLADYVIHTHDDACYASDGTLVCTLPEVAAHVHVDGCYELQRGELTCGLSDEPHVHTDACYSETTEPTCGLSDEPHVHTDACYTYATELVCSLSDEPHVHTDACYVYANELACGLEGDPDHVHTDACYQMVPYLVCGLTEGEPAHVHTDACYQQTAQLTCGLAEGEQTHVHTEECYQTTRELTCGLTEGEPEHVHDNSCYAWNPVLVCGCAEVAPHTHTDACYDESGTLVCGKLQTAEHQHGEGCFSAAGEPVLVCTVPEHTHTLACYSNPSADVEDRATWEASMAGVELTGVWADDVLAIARTQLGYEESPNNYEVDENAVTTKGWTRYGAWYGDPYGDWCAMFVSFCLNYAGVPSADFPREASCPRWIAELSSERWDLYRPFDSDDPNPGDLVFFDYEDDGVSDHVGLVVEVVEATETEPRKLRTIEGNSSNRVQYVVRDLDDETIMGYAALPENPELQPEPVEEPTDEPVSEPVDETFELTADASDGTRVTLTGPASSLPFPADELTVTVEVVASEGALALVDAAVADTELADGVVYLYDVRLWHDGVEVEPVGPVALTFAGIAELDAAVGDDAAGAPKVFHVDEANDQATDMNAAVADDGSVVVDTDHFSIYGVVVPASGSAVIEQTISAVWDEATNSLTSVSFTVTSEKTDKLVYQLQYSDNATGKTPVWNNLGDASGQIKKEESATFTLSASDLESAPLGRAYRVYGYKDKNNSGYTDAVALPAMLDAVKPGFSTWLAGSYIEDFGGTTPKTLNDLYAAFAFYKAMPAATLATSTDEVGHTWVNVAVDPSGSYAYAWEYQLQKGAWQTLTTNEGEVVTGALFDASAISALCTVGADVRCKVYEANEDGSLKLDDAGNPVLVTVSDPLFVSPNQTELDAVIAQINAELNLGTLAIGSTAASGGSEWQNFFYGNVAADPDVPFSDATSYANYLANLYTTGGIDAVRSAWDYYLYDLYDPNWSKMGNTNAYPQNTYGDTALGWPKDGSSSFHTTSTPSIDPLRYDFVENGVDYSNFVTDMDKTATAVASGDNNTERQYDIDITADAQAKVTAPVAMILQIQTSWQMFDMDHANAVTGDGYTEVGAVANNYELANLYAIKQALLRFVDYMEYVYPGNNLVLGITEVQHAGSSSMFTTDANGKSLYVSNNYAALRQAILDWDSFGNCEHVHYDTTALKAAVTGLETNLTGWEDVYQDPIEYNDIQKVVVVIGGPTENSSGTNGYGCVLPWDTFQKEQFNAVYGIRTNTGTSNGSGYISWLDNPKNIGGTPFVNGTGDAFTQRYIATTEDAVFNTLVTIAKNEMNKKGLDVKDETAHVENVAMQDVVSSEFELDPSLPITVTVRDKDGNAVSQASFLVDDLQYADNGDGSKTATLTDEATSQTLTVTAYADGTTRVACAFGTVYNTQQCNLHFRVKAKEDYIGSNNVFSNVGTPSLTYQHTKVGEETKTYSVDCSDTPQVNVPIRFSTVDGGTATIKVNDSVDFAKLGELIAEDAQRRVEKYSQINGILSYVWVLPDGTEVEAGSVEVVNGSIGWQKISADGYAFVGKTVGTYTGTLKVTFTPEDVDTESGNFSDSSTSEPVSPLTKPGDVVVVVEDDGSGTGSSEPTTLVRVNKVWADGNENHADDSVTFVLYQSVNGGEPVATGQRITLNASKNWTGTFTGLPYTDASGNKITYSVVETNIPEGYYCVDGDDIPREELNTGAWVSASGLEDGKIYVFSHTKDDETGALAANSSNGLTVESVQRNTGSVQVGDATYTPTLDGVSDEASWKAIQSGDRFLLQNVQTGKYLMLSEDGYSLSSDLRDGTKDTATTYFTWSGDSDKMSLYGTYFKTKKDDGTFKDEKKKYLKIDDKLEKVSDEDGKQSLDLFTYVTDSRLGSGNLAPKYYEFTATNAKWDPIYGGDTSGSFKAEANKTIDYLGDGGINTDTNLTGSDLYRLYLDVIGNANGVDLLIVEDSTTSMKEPYGTDSTRIQTLDALLNGTITSGAPAKGDYTESLYSGASRADDGFVYRFLASNSNNKVAVVKFYNTNGTTGQAYESIKDQIVPVTKGWQSATAGMTPESCYTNVIDMLPGTNYETAFLRIDEMLQQVIGDGNAKLLLFISDGEPNGTVENGINVSYNANFEHTKAAWDQVQAQYPALPVYTIGICAGSNAEGILKYISGDSRFASADDPVALDAALQAILAATQATSFTITDELSEYVVWNGACPDLKVVRSDANGKNAVVVWQSQDAVQSGTIGAATEANKVVQNGVEIDAVQNVTFTPGASGDEGGTLTVQFNPALAIGENTKYTVSFNVRTSNTALRTCQEQISAGEELYAGTVGDAGTDYGKNSTSSGQPGFYSNASANVSCSHNGNAITMTYDKPVVQVANDAYELPKTGGIGTTLYTWGGAALVAAALVWLIRARIKRGREGSGLRTAC